MSWLVLHWLYMYVLRQIKIMLCYVMYWFSRPFVFVCAIVCLGDRSSVRYHSFVWSFDVLMVRLCDRSIFLSFVCVIVRFFIVCLCDHSVFLSFVCMIVRFFYRSFVWSFDFFIVCLCDHLGFFLSFVCVIVRFFIVCLCDHLGVFLSFVCVTVRFLWFVCAIMVVYVIVRFCSRSFVYVIVRLFIRLTIVCDLVRFGDSS